MRVLVTGGTGVLGRRLVPHLLARGHDVAVLTRSPANAALVEGMGARAAPGDLFDAGSVTRAAEGTHVIVHAATAIPTMARPFSWHWRENDRIRIEGTRSVLEAARRAGAGKVVFQSITWLARQPDGSPFDEESPPHPDRVTASALEGERLLAEAAREHGIVGTTLRCGFFYAPESAHMAAFRDAVQGGYLPLVGPGPGAVLCPLHVEDAATAFTEAVETPLPGVWHVVDDHPVTVSDFFRELGRLAGARREPPRIPRWLARAAMGSNTVAFLTVDGRTSNERFRKATGWAPRFPSYREGLADVFATWAREAGTAPVRAP